MCVDKDQHLVPKSKDPQNLDIHAVYRQNRCDIKDPEITTIKKQPPDMKLCIIRQLFLIINSIAEDPDHQCRESVPQRE